MIKYDLNFSTTQVHVDITHSEDKVKIDGPPEEVERAQVELDDFVKNLLATLTYVELSVDPKFFKHIIGKSGSNSKFTLIHVT